MRLKFSNKYMKWGFTAFFVIIASISFYYLVFHINTLLYNFFTCNHRSYTCLFDGTHTEFYRDKGIKSLL